MRRGGGSTWFHAILGRCSWRLLRVGEQVHVGQCIRPLPLEVFLDGGLVLSPLNDGPFPGWEASVGADLGDPLLLIDLGPKRTRRFVKLVLKLENVVDGVRLFLDKVAMDPLGVELLQSPEAHR